MNRFNRKKEVIKSRKIDQIKMKDTIAKLKNEIARLTLGNRSERLNIFNIETERVVCQHPFDYWNHAHDSVRYEEHIKPLIIRSISEKLYEFADLKTEGNMVRCEILVAKLSK